MFPPLFCCFNSLSSTFGHMVAYPLSLTIHRSIGDVLLVLDNRKVFLCLTARDIHVCYWGLVPWEWLENRNWFWSQTFRKQVSSGLQVSLLQRQAQKTAVLIVLCWVPAKAAGLVVPSDKSHDSTWLLEYTRLYLCALGRIQKRTSAF